VPVSRDQVKSAPNIELHGDELSPADESTLYHHYQLNYTPPDTERGRAARTPLTLTASAKGPSPLGAHALAGSLKD
jgi:hypothetical protein